jgi:hypothetical protein
LDAGGPFLAGRAAVRMVADRAAAGTVMIRPGYSGFG